LQQGVSTFVLRLPGVTNLAGLDQIAAAGGTTVIDVSSGPAAFTSALTAIRKACQSGVCKCPGAEVPCFGACVDTSTDSKNCGTCGTQCSGTSTCQGGVCRLAPGDAGPG
jgi:hypothetical protein